MEDGIVVIIGCFDNLKYINVDTPKIKTISTIKIIPNNFFFLIIQLLHL
jgi:hypothetical protein